MEASEEKPPDTSSMPKLAETTVYIWNMSEDVWPFISAISNPKEQKHEIEENAYLGDREIFSFAGEDDVVFVTPCRMSDEFLNYYLGLFGNKNLRIVVTKKHTGEICRDILTDEYVMNEIVHAANHSKRLTMISYTTSVQFLRLVEEIRLKGITVFTPEAPEEEDAWTVNFFGSKSGIRQLAQKSSAKEPDFVMTDGMVVDHITDAAKIAAGRYIKRGGVVLKTNKGHSGAGILIFRPGELPQTYKACEQAIYEILEKDEYWERFPIVVEDYVQINRAIGAGSPSVEFRIYKSGRIDYLYYCGMRMVKDGIFGGVEIANDVLPTKIATQLVDTGFYIAEQYAQSGYRGYFDVDFVASKNGTLYVTESNVRRTGGTFVYAVADHVFGKDFMYETHIVSNNLYEIPNKKSMTFHDAYAILTPILFNKKTKEGLIITSENTLLQHKLSYIIFGKTEKRAYEIEARMSQLLS